MNKLSGNFVKSNSFNLKANRFKQKFNSKIITLYKTFYSYYLIKFYP